MVEKLNPSNLVQNWIICVVRHVVRYNRWISSSLEREYSSFEQNLVLSGQQFLGIGDFISRLPIPSGSFIEQSPSDRFFDFIDRGLQTLHDSLTFESFNSV